MAFMLYSGSTNNSKKVLTYH